ncbi:MAG: HTTM domain-containing protein [Bacteroidota bacterium]
MQLSHLFSKQYFYKPIDNSQIVLWRIFFGFLMACESFGAIATGWVKKTLIDPQFTFNFIGLDFLQPLPGSGMYFYFTVMGIFSLMVMVGYRYRMSAVALALLWSGAYLMQKTSYNNHYYLVFLICWVMVFVDAHRYAALDVRRTGTSSLTCPNWYRLFFIIQLFIVFTFGALAKLYPGWWEGDFIKLSFNHKKNYWLIGPLLGKEWFQMFITYSGLIFDAIIIPMLLWKRTRLLAMIGLLIFNLFNSVVFQIGIFPYAVLALTIFFYEPETIRRVFFKKKTIPINDIKPINPTGLQRLALPIFIIYFAIQFALPVRHHFIPGDVNWREEGHRLSWRMMLRSKSGFIRLESFNPQTNERKRVKPRDYLSPKQASKLSTKPDFLWQFVQRLKQKYRAEGKENMELYVKSSKVRLNGKKSRPLFKKDIDLMQVDWNYFGRNEWVLDKIED